MTQYPTKESLLCHLQMPIFSIIQEEADRLGRECYVIGGYVRDIFLKRPSKDIDVVTVGSGIELAQAVAHRLGRRAHLAVFKNFGTAQVKSGGLEVEFVGARRESYSHDSRKPVVEDGTLEDDQNRRDLTINALAICLNRERFGELVDPFHGLEDLHNGIIRTPLDPDITFSDDPLRMLRAIRFATRFDFKIVPETFEAIARNRDRINIISGERIIDELDKINMTQKPSKGWLLLQRCGLLQIIFPELQALSGIENRDGRGHKDNFYHTLEVLDNVAATGNQNLWLRWAALMHDLGKAKVKSFDEKVGWTFHNHDYVGCRMVKPIFRRLKLPLGAELKFVEKMVQLHMRPIGLADEGITDSAIRRLLFDAGDDIDSLMTLCEADVTSKNAERVKLFLEHFKIVRQKLVEIEEKDRIRNWQPPVDGLEIMERYHLAPCREVGTLKTALKDAILDGKIPNEHDAAIVFLDDLAREIGVRH
jgi:poly(A) polymerase